MKSSHFLVLIWLIFSSFLSAQATFKYSYIPKKLYHNQIFPITIIHTQSDRNSTTLFEFDSWSNTQPLFEKPLIIKNSNDEFYTFYFKATDREITTPRIFITHNNQSSMLEPQHLYTTKLNKPDNFSSVIATDLKLSSYQISKYDESSYLVTLSIDALEANLEDIHIKDSLDEGFDKFKRSFSKVSGDFFIILPNSMKKLEFSYFNSIKKQFEDISIKLEIQDSTVTTQSDLNPKYDSFELLKKYLFISLVALFFIMFIIKRDFFYLVLGVVSLITLLTFYIPHKKICIQRATKLYILPTYTSRISAIIQDEYNTTVLGEHNGYKKVEYKNNNIGWIKDEDVCED
jgi:hypothetical protein